MTKMMYENGCEILLYYFLKSVKKNIRKSNYAENGFSIVHVIWRFEVFIWRHSHEKSSKVPPKPKKTNILKMQPEITLH